MATRSPDHSFIHSFIHSLVRSSVSSLFTCSCLCILRKSYATKFESYLVNDDTRDKQINQFAFSARYIGHHRPDRMYSRMVAPSTLSFLCSLEATVLSNVNRLIRLFQVTLNPMEIRTFVADFQTM